MSTNPMALIIEDDHSQAMHLLAIVKNYLKMSVLHATCAEDGYQLAMGLRPSLILLDLHLPDAHGLELLCRIKCKPELRAIPVLVVSADKLIGTIEDAFSLGAEGYLKKPFNRNQLLSSIQEMGL
ncbi:PleD family two-component system response regulator [Bowmanella sp. JS7-9]|uniref:PleD family two-component system response regulator n=1 Tax=Pseudobowmanella zhangzhouensis TaxID=1537679 RepID=A0ABW1XKI4_9ALTE|nr:response regulator [Bowmanella sp. JS7-9]